jgi:hypothetical protein
MISSVPIVTAQTPPCYFCNNDSIATISNPNAVIDLTSFNLGIPSATCQQIDTQLKLGIVSSAQCTQITTDPQSYSLLQKPCGCSNLTPVQINKNPIPSPSSGMLIEFTIPSPVPTPATTDDQIVETVVCNLCNGNPDAYLTKPNAQVDLSPLGEPNELFACNVLFQAGLDGSAFLQEECDILSIDADFQTLCGCQDSKTAIVTAPYPIPVTVRATTTTTAPSKSPVVPVVPSATKPTILVPVIKIDTIAPTRTAAAAPSVRAPVANSVRKPQSEPSTRRFR